MAPPARARARADNSPRSVRRDRPIRVDSRGQNGSSRGYSNIAIVRRRRSMWCSSARVASTPTSWVAGDSGALSASLRRPPSTSRSRPSAAGLIARPGPAGPAQHPALAEVERHQRHVGLAPPTAHTHIELRLQPFGGEQLPVERRDDEGRRTLGDRAQHADEHAVQPWVRLAFEGQLVGRLEHGERLRCPVEARQQRRQRFDRLGLADDVELAAAIQQQPDVAHRLEAGAELRRRLAHALGDGAHLPVLLGEEDDDAVGLAELVGAEHDRRVTVEVTHARSAVIEAAEPAAAGVEVVDR